jgi:MSHA biogenesis protein MshL
MLSATAMPRGEGFPSKRVAGAGHWAAALLLLGLAGCSADRPLRTPPVDADIRAELATAAKPAPAAVPARVSEALAEPAVPAVAPAPEPKLDLLVNNASAREVFLAIVADTRYSMLMHPDVGGSISVTLRGVTVPEALEAIRDVYGYDFKIDGRRITVYAPSLQTRIFTVDYLHALRVGSSELRVNLGEATQNSSGSSTGTTNSAAPSSGAGSSNQPTSNSRVSTSSRTDFWMELADALKAAIGNGPGRSVVTSPQAGIVQVRAMPDELRQVEKFLNAAKLAVERQVMLEAKIVEVELRDGFQSGIDWSALRTSASRNVAVGVVGGSGSNALSGGVAGVVPGFSATAPTLLPDNVALPTAGGGLFGLALATDGFQGVLGFLETRGDVQILSSPRIATLNNQKAVFKVGTDDFFVTSVSAGSVSNTGTTGTNGATQTTLPTLTLSSFFSGIALDVTPQIDAGNIITLHVHPAVSSVTEKSKQIDLGTMGNYRLPLASSSVNESDTIVRIQDGNIVAIGGLMQSQSSRQGSGLPGTTDSGLLGTLFGNRANSGRKKELVVLIKPSIIRNAADWEQQTRRSRAALDDMDTARARVIRIDGTVEEGKPKAAQ